MTINRFIILTLAAMVLGLALAGCKHTGTTTPAPAATRFDLRMQDQRQRHQRFHERQVERDRRRGLSAGGW